MARFRKLETGLLTVGLVSTAKYYRAAVAGALRDDYPGIDLRLRVSQNREQLLLDMHANEVDLAIMGRPPKELATRAEPFAANPLVFIAPPEHPIGRVGHPPLAALESYPFIVRERGSARAMRWRRSSPNGASNLASRWRCRATRRSSRR